MLTVNLYSAIDIGYESTSKSSPFCIIKFHKVELGRTEPCFENPSEPFWNCNFAVPFHKLEGKVLENQRPLFFEYLEIELYLHADATECVGVARVRLVNFHRPEWCRLIGCVGKLQGKSCGRVLVGLAVTPLHVNTLDGIRMIPLNEVLPPSVPKYSQLYINIQHTSQDALLTSQMPGPLVGEVLQDRHNCVEWKVAVGNNAFGDKFFVTCVGGLYITDLRVIFVPEEVSCPSWCGLPSVHYGQTFYPPEALLLIRRATYQMPLSCIEDCKVRVSDSNSIACCLELHGRDMSATEFTVRLPGMNTHSGGPIQRNKRPEQFHSHLLSTLLPSNPAAASLYELQCNALNQSDSAIGSPLYNNGLDTDGMLPSMWCSRVQDMILWAAKEDFTLLRWSKYIKATCIKLFDKHSLPKIREPISVDEDYQRLHVMEAQWNMVDVNFNFDICSTYPQTLVLPSVLTQEEIVAAASQRSKGRLPSLVWLHPQSHASLCRCSQPVVGLSGMPEHDKHMLVTIKAMTTSGLPMRIADARPRINAQANAMQGKGYENIAYMGGASVASLTFLDIDNIHVMRSSLAKLRENATGASSGSAHKNNNDGSSTSSSMSGNADAVTASKWLYHVSNVLRGASGCAESLLQGHPVLVHCSDGWDRTAQLSSLAQVMIDPFYRTIEGLFVLITKDWCAFGHKFEDRLGETKDKETSPVFLQFIDCLYQLCVQFPIEFEYSTHLLTIFSQAAYSGYFSTFRENSECGRYAFLQKMFQSDRLESDDLQYSTVFTYIRILLRSSVAHSLTNPYYQTLDFKKNTLKYLRPRCTVTDLHLWREGLFGINQPNFKGFMPNSPNLQECAAVSSTASAKYYEYVALHTKELSSYTSDKLARYIMGASASTLVPVVPYTIKTSRNYYHISTTRAMEIPTVRLAPFEVAAVRIQCWFRAHYSVHRALSAGELLLTRPKVKLILVAFLWSELRHRYVSHVHTLDAVWWNMRTIITDALEDAMTFCLRKEAAEARVVAFEQLLIAQAEPATYSPTSSPGNWLSDSAMMLGDTFSGGRDRDRDRERERVDSPHDSRLPTNVSNNNASTSSSSSKSIFSVFMKKK